MTHFTIGKQLIEDLLFDAYTTNKETRREAMAHLAIAQVDALIRIAEALEENVQLDRLGEGRGWGIKGEKDES